MLRRIWLMFAFVLSCAEPAFAQSDSARIARLEAQVDSLKAVLGLKFLNRPPQPSDLVPANELQPSGRYPYILSDYQIRLGLAEMYVNLSAKADSALARVYQLSVQTAAVSGKVDQHIAEGANSTGLLTMENGTLYVPQRIVIGQCKRPSHHMLILCGQKDAEIRMDANLDGTNPQYQDPAVGRSPAYSHMFGAQADGGTRWEFNWVCRTGDPAPTVNNGACWVVSDRPRVILGFDSQGTLSFSEDRYPVIDNSQTWIYKIDRDNKWAGFSLMKAGYTHQLWSSTVTNSFDKRYSVPQQ